MVVFFEVVFYCIFWFMKFWIWDFGFGNNCLWNLDSFWYMGFNLYNLFNELFWIVDGFDFILVEL